ncbi:MAG: D-alanyl-D-alanine carboxypeptidase [Anaplasmataceae bacterium]|nr:D-alanyl-D-alanine carboxypeptidase [Anaplasmataceae bacterium]
MTNSWHKILFLIVLFGVVTILNVQPHAEEVELFEDRSSNLLAAETARLLPRQYVVDNQEGLKISRTLSISESQALIPLSGGPLEEPEQKDSNELQTSLALAVDVINGEVFFEENVNRRWSLASLSKMMTAVTASKLLSKDQVVKISDSDFSPLDPSEYHSLKVGESYTVEDLIRAMMVGSSNQAAEALARIAGREEFIKEMNSQAANWGMPDTYFGDPTGLSSVNQSTLNDVKTMVGHIWREYPEVFAYSRPANRSLTDPLTRKTVTVYAIHRFAGRADFLGGKTGYTEAAKENLVSLFDIQGRTILIVVMGSDNRFSDTDKLLRLVRERIPS